VTLSLVVKRQLWAILGFAIVVLILMALLHSDYFELVLTQVLLWAMMSVAWNILCGYSGYFSFGHAAFWGLGAYTVALGLIHFDLSPWLTIPASAIVGGLAGALIGFPTFRLRGHYFALAMLAYPLATLYVFQWLGYQEIPLPMKREAPILYMQFADPRAYVELALGLLVISLLVSLKVENSRFGMSLFAIKQNEPAAEAAGIDTWRWKMLALMLSGALAAVAGGLYAVVLLVVTPEAVFGMLVSAQALILALFGGVGTLWGPVIGAVVLVPLAEGLNARLGDVLPGIQGVVYGIAIIAIILLAPEGVYWRIRDRLARHLPETAPMPTVRAMIPAVPREVRSQTAGENLLVLRDVSISFGGLRALDGVDLSVPEGGLYGIIGPNGAGKTTLFNVINGFLSPERGSVSFAGESLVGLRPNRVCRLGIGRTFQVVRAFGLSARANALAGGLTNRELRLMELARALAPQPRLILLDETLAGLGHDDLDGILGAIRLVRAGGVTVLIIEHTMQAMVQLVDHFDVLDHGRLIASGAPETVVRNHEVIEAYLGKKWAEQVAEAAK
jgi:branched-chain amino acid transport system permease protein